MCGIAGAVTSNPIPEQVIRETVDSLWHRGPDDRRFMTRSIGEDLYLTLIFTRLSIIDTSSYAMQPIDSELSCLVLNGEIYNYKKIARQLKNKKKLVSNGDVEVAARFIDERGIEGIREFDGMYALARFDFKKKELLLARDYFGEKPLFYLQNSQGVFFSSEIPALKKLAHEKLSIQKSMISMFLHTGYKNLNWEDDSFFEKVKKIPSGTSVVFSSKGELLKRISLREGSTSEELTSKLGYLEARDLTREEVIHAVDSRLVADVPLGICLSGGVDSSILAAIAKMVLGRDIPAYFLKSSDARYDESKQVQVISEHLSIETNVIEMHQGVDRFYEILLEGMTRKRSSPVITSTYLVHALLMQKMSQDGIKVSLMGTAADELFSGYYDHHLAFFRELHDESAGDELLGARKKWEDTVRPYVRNPYLQNYRYYIENPLARHHNHSNEEILSDYLYMSKKFTMTRSSNQLSSKFLRNRLRNELFHETTPVILAEDDANSMYFSIENRSPFLAKSLFQTVNRFPSRYLIRNGLAKYILRDAFSDLLPKSILFETKKSGFNASVWELFPFLRMEDSINKYIRDDSGIWNWVKREEFHRLVNSAHGNGSLEKLLFSIISTKIFLDCNEN